jgi:hypothetical protein
LEGKADDIVAGIKKTLDNEGFYLLLFSLASIASASPGLLIERRAFADHQMPHETDCFL